MSVHVIDIASLQTPVAEYLKTQNVSKSDLFSFSFFFFNSIYTKLFNTVQVSEHKLFKKLFHFQDCCLGLL